MFEYHLALSHQPFFYRFYSGAKVYIKKSTTICILLLPYLDTEEDAEVASLLSATVYPLFFLQLYKSVQITFYDYYEQISEAPSEVTFI